MGDYVGVGEPPLPGRLTSIQYVTPRWRYQVRHDAAPPLPSRRGSPTFALLLLQHGASELAARYMLLPGGYSACWVKPTGRVSFSHQATAHGAGDYSSWQCLMFEPQIVGIRGGTTPPSGDVDSGREVGRWLRLRVPSPSPKTLASIKEKPSAELENKLLPPEVCPLRRGGYPRRTWQELPP
jgi:hypothetical protein